MLAFNVGGLLGELSRNPGGVGMSARTAYGGRSGHPAGLRSWPNATSADDRAGRMCRGVVRIERQLFTSHRIPVRFLLRSHGLELRSSVRDRARWIPRGRPREA